MDGLAGADRGGALVVVVAVAAPGLMVCTPTVPILVVVVAALPGFTFFAPEVVAGALTAPTAVAASRKNGFFP